MDIDENHTICVDERTLTACVWLQESAERAFCSAPEEAAEQSAAVGLWSLIVRREEKFFEWNDDEAQDSD